MEDPKQEFVDFIKELRAMLKTDECAECSCPNIRCEWHGDCYNCMRIYRHLGSHVPRCLQFVIDKKIDRIIEATENERQKRSIKSDDYYDYLHSVAPKEDENK